jgi:hypothetical protein
MYAMNAKEISDSSYFLTVLVEPLITIPRKLWTEQSSVQL